MLQGRVCQRGSCTADASGFLGWGRGLAQHGQGVLRARCAVCSHQHQLWWKVSNLVQPVEHQGNWLRYGQVWAVTGCFQVGREN